MIYFYCKRKVLNDGVSIELLDFELCFVKSKKEYEVEIDDFDFELVYMFVESE